jgi:hypothetical protein
MPVESAPMFCALPHSGMGNDEGQRRGAQRIRSADKPTALEVPCSSKWRRVRVDGRG